MLVLIARGLVVCVTALVALAGCAGTTAGVPVGRPESPAASLEIEQGHLLLFPVAKPEELLGRSVKVTGDGAWSIADHRASGCELSAHRLQSNYRVHRRVGLSSVTTFSGGFSKLIGIEAGFGSASQAEIDIQNTMVLTAETRGDCGDVFVDRVFVGTGRRTLLADTRANASAKLPVPGAPAGGVGTQSHVVDETAWDSEQAYAFSFKKATGTQDLQLRIEMPPRVVEGDEVSVRFESSRPVYLVVYYLDADGKGTVLWPSTQEPEPMSRPGQPAVLPSEAERAAGIRIQAALGRQGVGARETLVAYGFTEKTDFLRLRPPAGAVAEGGAEHAAKLSNSAQELPLQSWSRALFSYVITPRVGSGR